MERKDYSRAFAEAKYRLVVLKRGTKVPYRNDWPNLNPDAMEVGWHIDKFDCNYGVLLNGLAVIDVDRTPASRPIFDKMRKERVWHSPLETGTFKGRHVFTKLADQTGEVKSRIRALGFPWDWKLTGCVVGPGSHIEETGWTYQLLTKEIVPPDVLPAFPVEWLKEVKQTPAKPLSNAVGIIRDSLSAIACPEKYILKIESIQGCNGSAGLVRAVCVMRDAGRSAQETFDYLMAVWNQEPRVSPLWSAGEIRYCVERHFK